MSAPLNLARQPFRNERLPGLVFALALVLLVVVTIRHAVVIAALLPARTTARFAESASLEQEVAELRRAGSELRGPGPDRATLARWAAVKDLVDRRAFLWTRLLARFEDVLPRGVRLRTIAPRWEKEGLRLSLTAVARSPADGFELVESLEALPDFEDVLPTSKDPGDQGYDFQYEMRYLPQAAPAGAAASGAGTP
jgi:Tfp pilus assembly protein PilN